MRLSRIFKDTLLFVLIAATLMSCIGCAFVGYVPEATSVPFTTGTPIPSDSLPTITPYPYTAKNLMDNDSLIKYIKSANDRGFDIKNADTSFCAYIFNRYYIKQLVDQNPNLSTIIAGIYMTLAANVKTYTMPTEMPMLKSDVNLCMQAILHDCPELFNVDTAYTYYTNKEEEVLRLDFTYLITNDRYYAAVCRTYSILDSWCRDLDGATQYEKELAIYTNIIEKCTYTLVGDFIDTSYGAIVLGKALCQGYACALTLAMHYVGIECFRVSGEAKDIDTGESEPHAWNIIQIDGKFYHADPTWDDYDPKKSTECTYAYFNVTDKEMYSHRVLKDWYDNFDIPKCNTTQSNYYYRNNLFISKNDDLNERFVEFLNDLAKGIEHDRLDRVLLVKVASSAQLQTLEDKQYEWVKAWNSTAEQIAITSYKCSFSKNTNSAYFIYTFKFVK